MFFSIRKTEDSRFPIRYQIHDFIINVDQGWKTQTLGNKKIVYKGYLDQGNFDLRLAEIVNNIKPTIMGNFCAIVVDATTVTIHHARYRSFPMVYQLGVGIENLSTEGTQVWADQVATLDNTMQLTFKTFDIIEKNSILADTLSREEVIVAVDRIIKQKFKDFLQENTLPVNMFLSGGIDTTMLYGYLKKETTNFKIQFNNHIDHDWFWMTNHADLSKYATYKNIHHWQDPSILLSGRPGDEYFLRGNVALANMVLMHHGIDLLDILSDSKFKNCLHYNFMNRPDYLKIIKQDQQNTYIQTIVKNKVLLDYAICRRCLNDFQGSHIGNTLTWTPLRDLEILKLFLKLDIDDLLMQMLDSTISKELISRLDPKLSDLLSGQKNTFNYLSTTSQLLPDDQLPRLIQL
jgi:hypothetical protein